MKSSLFVGFRYTLYRRPVSCLWMRISRNGRELLFSNSNVNLIEGSTSLRFLTRLGIFTCDGYRKRISSMYLKQWLFLGKMYWKGPDSRNSKYRHARTGDKGEPIGNPDFCLQKASLKLKKLRSVHRVHIFIILSYGKGRDKFVFFLRWSDSSSKHFFTGTLVNSDSTSRLDRERLCVSIYEWQYYDNYLVYIYMNGNTSRTKSSRSGFQG